METTNTTETSSAIKRAILLELEYSAWANRTLLECCSTLSTEELERNLGSSHGSIAATLRHIYYTERVWLQRLRANVLPPANQIGDQRLFRDPDPEPSLTELAQNWPEVAIGLMQYIEPLTAADLEEDLAGPDSRFTRWKILLHSVNHSTLHRGQAMTMLRQLGKQPPNLDILGYIW